MSSIRIRKQHQLTGHNSAIYALVPGPVAGSFLSASGDGMIVMWSLENPEQGKLLAQVDTQVFSLAYLPATDTLVAGDMNGGVHWLNLQEDKPNKHLSHHRKGTYAFLVLGDQLFSVGGDGVLTRWDALAQRSLESFQLSNMPLRSIHYHHQRRELVVGSSDHSIYLLDVDDLALREHWVGAHENSVFTVSYHPYLTNVLLSAGRDAQLKVWDITQQPPQVLSQQPAHWFTINDLIFHPEQHIFLTASRDKTIRIWNGDDFKLIKTLDAARDGGHINSINSLLWIPGSSTFVSASDDRSLILWEWEDLEG